MAVDHPTVNVCNIPLQFIKYENPDTSYYKKVVIGKDVLLLEMAIKT